MFLRATFCELLIDVRSKTFRDFTQDPVNRFAFEFFAGDRLEENEILEDQKKRAAIQSANRRGVTWGDYCKTYGLPAQKLMTALLQHRGLFRKNPISNEWSVNPKYSDCFRIIKPSDQKFSAGGYNFRFNAKGLEVFGRPETIDKMKGILIAFTGTDQQKQEYLLKQAKSGKQKGL